MNGKSLEQIQLENLHTRELFLEYYSQRDWNFYRPLLADLVRHAPPGKILDVGCGLGYFLECAFQFGFEAEGIEGSPYAVTQCKHKGYTVYEQLLSQPFPYPDEVIAAVVINQVIEHLPRQVAWHVLQESNRVLQKSGVLIIKSPSKFDPIQRKEEEHINLYTPSLLYREVKKAGFIIVDRSNVFREFGLGKLGRVWAKLTYNIFQWDFLCNSANCIARKP